MNQPLLQVKDLRLYYFTSKGVVKALEGVSFDLMPGETLGLVGESGCGKTTTGLALINMPTQPGKIVQGSIKIDGTEIVGMSEQDLRKEIRWSKISMVFQGAMNCLTPVYTVGKLLMETYTSHSKPGLATSKSGAAETQIKKYIKLVGLPESVFQRFPHELSGGMKQRVVIAMALFLEPKLIILDEPTTALDVIVQAQILNLLKSLKKELGLSYIFITHDLATEAEVADRIMIMYAGKMAELSTNECIFAQKEQGTDSANVGPLHPYTQKLLESTPRLHKRVSELAFIPGAPPNLINPPKGCAFAPRCIFAKNKCRQEEPTPQAIPGQPGHLVACWKAVKDTGYAES